jgi:exosortase
VEENRDGDRNKIVLTPSTNSRKELSVKPMIKHINKRNLLFIFLSVVAVGMGYTPLRDLLTSPTHTEYYSHILLIPLVSGYFIYSGRKEIFSDLKYSYTTGILLLIIGLLLFALGWYQGHQLNQNDYTSLMTFSVLIFWIGDFILFYGTQAFRSAIFPLLFLVFMIPIPSVLMDRIIYLLLVGSNEVTYMLFWLIGVPFLRDGFTFHLPGRSIEVAKECSGIRSSLGLFITGILAGHLFLKMGWRKFILVLFVFPIAVLKNGIRIATLSLLAIYVDGRFLTDSFLHRSGGFIFFIPALFLLGVILWLLGRSEKAEGLIIR